MSPESVLNKIPIAEKTLIWIINGKSSYIHIVAFQPHNKCCVFIFNTLTHHIKLSVNGVYINENSTGGTERLAPHLFSMLGSTAPHTDKCTTAHLSLCPFFPSLFHHCGEFSMTPHVSPFYSFHAGIHNYISLKYLFY